MKIIIDANRIIAALIKPGTTRVILFDEDFEFLTPDYTLTEINKHKDELMKKANLTSEEFDILINVIFEHIIILPAQEYSQFIKICKQEICDIADVPYLTACLATKSAGIWSHDPHFSKQGSVKVFTNIDLLAFSRSAKSD